jgi:hypothetical protein
LAPSSRCRNSAVFTIVTNDASLNRGPPQFQSRKNKPAFF